jgi:branched-chain amino acid aminotransferase
MAGYDDRDGFIWMDGKLVDWRSANVHILTHALHYASAVFEGERCYNGRIFKMTEHSERLRRSAQLLDMDLPWTVAEIDGRRHGGSLAAEPDPHGRGCLDMGQLLRRRQVQGRQT